MRRALGESISIFNNKTPICLCMKSSMVCVIPTANSSSSVQEFVVSAKLKSLPLAQIQYEGSKSPGEVLLQGQLYQGFLISIAQGFSKPFFLGLVTCRDDC